MFKYPLYVPEFGNSKVGGEVGLVSVKKVHPEIQISTKNTGNFNLNGRYETYSSSFKNTFSITKKREIYRPAITATVTRTFISCMIPLNKIFR